MPEDEEEEERGRRERTLAVRTQYNYRNHGGAPDTAQPEPHTEG